MENKTKIILGVLAVAGISLYAYNKYSKKEPVKKDTDKKSEFLGLSFGKRKSSIVSKQYKPTTKSGDCPKGMSKVNVAAPNQLPDYRCRYND